MVGTAGWSIAREYAGGFPPDGTALERYSRVFNAVEVNSSFYRAHRPSTWARWAQSVPEEFRFAVKIPRTITHQAKLVDVGALVASFASEVQQLGCKLALLLVQLPPKLAFDNEIVERFFADLRSSIDAGIVCEPRNASWFQDDADAMLDRLRVARAVADPALCPAAALPGGWHGISYWRLHGSPTMYRSPYSAEAIDMYAGQIKSAVEHSSAAWCIFDNTAASEATGNARSLMEELRADRD